MRSRDHSFRSSKAPGALKFELALRTQELKGLHFTLRWRNPPRYPVTVFPLLPCAYAGDARRSAQAIPRHAPSIHAGNSFENCSRA